MDAPPAFAKGVVFLVAVVAAGVSVLPAALHRRHRWDGRFRGRLLGRGRRRWFVHLLGGTAEITVVAIDDGPHGFAEVAQ